MLGTLYLSVRFASILFRPVLLDREHLRRLLTFSVPLIAFASSNFIIRWCDVVIVKLYEGLDEVGQYALAYQGYSALQQLTVTAIVVFTPLIVSLKLKGQLEVVGRYFTRAVAHASAISALVLGLAAAPAHLSISAIFGSGFSGTADPFVLLLVALQMASVASLLASVLLAIESTGTLGRAAAIGVLLNVAMGLALVPAIGLSGVALATTVANWFIAWRYSGAVERALPGGRGEWLLASAPLVAGVAPLVLMEGDARYVVGPAACALTFVGVVRFTSLVVLEDREILERLRLPAGVQRLLARGIQLAASGP
jgi:O-antigen/teichoic acid export membrane protein